MKTRGYAYHIVFLASLTAVPSLHAGEMAKPTQIGIHAIEAVNIALQGSMSGLHPAIGGFLNVPASNGSLTDQFKTQVQSAGIVIDDLPRFRREDAIRTLRPSQTLPQNYLHKLAPDFVQRVSRPDPTEQERHEIHQRIIDLEKTVKPYLTGPDSKALEEKMRQMAAALGTPEEIGFVSRNLDWLRQNVRRQIPKAKSGVREISESDFEAGSPDLETEDLHISRLFDDDGTRLTSPGKFLGLQIRTDARKIGSGYHAFVSEHPHIEGAVIKTEYSAADFKDGNSNQIKWVQSEESASRHLGTLGIAPRYLGRGRIDNHVAHVVERIYGMTVEDLMRKKKFTVEHYQLIMELLMRIAKAGAIPRDMRPANIMIGHTKLDSIVRAYSVNTDGLIRFADSRTNEESRLEALLHREIPLGEINPYSGVEPTMPLDDVLRQGLMRSGVKPPAKFFSVR